MSHQMWYSYLETSWEYGQGALREQERKGRAIRRMESPGPTKVRSNDKSSPHSTKNTKLPSKNKIPTPAMKHALTKQELCRTLSNGPPGRRRVQETAAQSRPSTPTTRLIPTRDIKDQALTKSLYQEPHHEILATPRHEDTLDHQQECELV